MDSSYYSPLRIAVSAALAGLMPNKHMIFSVTWGAMNCTILSQFGLIIGPVKLRKTTLESA